MARGAKPLQLCVTTPDGKVFPTVRYKGGHLNWQSVAAALQLEQGDLLALSRR